jgi:hypothetical protein
VPRQLYGGGRISSKGQSSRNPFECRLKKYGVSFPGNRTKRSASQDLRTEPSDKSKEQDVNGDVRIVPERDSRGIGVSCAFGEEYQSGIFVWRTPVSNPSDHKRNLEATKGLNLLLLTGKDGVRGWTHTRSRQRWAWARPQGHPRSKPPQIVVIGV